MSALELRNIDLSLGGTPVLLFVAAMVAGMMAQSLVASRKQD